jgi:gentisate 1,2-dioxygenase
MPYRHGAAEESVLFSFNDIPAMKALSLYREQ